MFFWPESILGRFFLELFGILFLRSMKDVFHEISFVKMKNFVQDRNRGRDGDRDRYPGPARELLPERDGAHLRCDPRYCGGDGYRCWRRHTGGIHMGQSYQWKQRNLCWLIDAQFPLSSVEIQIQGLCETLSVPLSPSRAIMGISAISQRVRWPDSPETGWGLCKIGAEYDYYPVMLFTIRNPYSVSEFSSQEVD
jgi:hypothetical protein